MSQRPYDGNITEGMLEPFIQAAQPSTLYSQAALSESARNIRSRAAKANGVKHCGRCVWNIRVGAFVQLVVSWSDTDGKNYENTETI